MLRFVKRFFWLALLAATGPSVMGYSLLGPINEAYQVPTIAYNLAGDIGAPKNLGEEYRWNTPTLYYTFDQNFLDYFGSNGVYAVEQAIAVFNNLTNVSSYSSDLSEFPLEAQRVNFRAQSLSLFDLKSLAMNLMIEQLGLAQPERYTWCLHNRSIGPGGCPGDVAYYVIKRNFDPVFSPPNGLQPSSYVNGNLYSYVILEACTGANPLADAIEFLVDPLAREFTAVADGGVATFGAFYTGLTRDDVGGLRYLLRTNNMNIESVAPGALLVSTNTTQPQLLVTSNLTLLVAQAVTNDAGTLQTLFPGLIVSSTSNFWVNVVTTNVFAYFTNLPYLPAGSAASLVLVTNFSTNVQQFFAHQFANVITNQYFTNGFIGIQDTTVAPVPFAPPGTLQTNVTTKASFVPGLIMGDYFLIPTNLNACGVSIITTQLTTTLISTNVITVATDATGVTNVNGQAFTRSLVYYFTNHYYIIDVVTCSPNSVALRQGIENIKFVRRDFDSLIGQFFEPITNTYTINAVNHNTLVKQTIQRRVTRPDILFSADDLAPGPAGTPFIPAVNSAARGIRFNQANALAGLAGPGTIEPDVTFTFNKVGPIYLNYLPNFLDESTQIPTLIFGSFDGTTNEPVIYPNGTSILDLENQVLMGITTSSLPSGTVGVDYGSQQLQASGGTQPYGWSLTPGSADLPPGLGLSSAGIISGTPDAGSAGIYDFVVRVTDAGARHVDRSFSIVINP